jgi:hypothetical protein
MSSGAKWESLRLNAPLLLLLALELLWLQVEGRRGMAGKVFGGVGMRQPSSEV